MSDPTKPDITPYAERTARNRIANKDIEDRLRHRFYWQAAVAGLVVVGLLVLGYRSWYVTDNKPDEALVAAVDELRSQVRELGGVPVAPPPEDIVENPPNVVGIPGPEGEQGPTGPQGRPGRDGRDGSPCLPTNPFCVGPAGEIGPTGEPGPSGSTGEPGSPGETGATGEPGPAGPTGPAGPEGPPGATGPGGASVVAVRLEQQDGRCLMITTTRDAFGTETDLSPVDIPQQFCQGNLPLELP